MTIKRLFFYLIITATLVIFSAGIFFIAEMLVRFAPPPKGQLIDVELFPYSDYVIHTQPRNTALGRSDNVLEGFFSHGPCDAEGGVTARFNALGFRGPDLPTAPKLPSEIRIIITGGSVSTSWNIGEACILDRLLERELGKSLPGKQIRVFNLGSGGWKSMQELIAIQLYGIRVQPDIVIHFSGFNDALHSIYMPVNQPYSGVSRVAFNRYRDSIHAKPLAFIKDFKLGLLVNNWLSPPINLSNPGGNKPTLPVSTTDPGPGRVFTKLSMPLDLAAIEARKDFSPYSDEVASNFVLNEAIMANVVAMKGGVVLSVLQPTLYLKQPLSDLEAKMMTPDSSASYAATVNFTVHTYAKLRKGLTALATEAPNVHFVDMSQVFDGRSEHIFGDYAHMNLRGYELITEKLTPKILQLLEKNKSHSM